MWPRLLVALKNIFTTTPSAIARVWKALGLRAAMPASASAAATTVVNYLKNNKMAVGTLALTLPSLLTDVPEFFSDPSIAKLLESQGLPTSNMESAGTGLAADLSSLQDEFALLNAGFGIINGAERFMMLKAALAVPDSTVALYLQVRNIR